MRRLLRSGAGLGLALSVFTCTDRSPSGPGGMGATAIDMSAFARAAVGDPPVPVDSVQITFRRADLSIAKDTALALAAYVQGDSFVVPFEVPLNQSPETFTLSIRAYGQGFDWYTASTTVQLTAGANPSASLTAQYVGPGAGADSVRVQGPATAIVGGVATPVTAVVYGGGGGAVITGVPVGYRVGNLAVAGITLQQLSTASVTGSVPVRDSTWLYAETPTHLKDSTRVHVVPPAASLAAVSGTGQTGPVGVALPAPLVARVLDMLGGPFKGQPVSWSVTAGSASLSATTTPSDDTGYASVTATPTGLGSLTVQATAGALSGSPQTFTATVAGASAIAIVSGNNQTDTIRAVLAPFVVRVTDALSNPVSGARVAWSRVAGSGTVSADTTVTDGAGLTQITYTLGAVPGAEQVQATLVGSTANVLFATTVTAGAVRSVTLDRANDTIPKSATLQYTATLRDGAGNVVVGTATWSSTAAGIASVNSSGLATALAGGNAKIIAASGGFADTADLWVRALTTVAVRPADTVITAVGDSLLLSATPLDNFGDTVRTGVGIRFITATPTVATVNATSGRVNIVGPGNAVVLGRDTVTGVQGPATLRVNQIPAAVTNTPADSILVGVGGRGQVVARALDRNGHPIPGKTINWISRNGSIATVDQLGVVTGVALGLAYVVDSLVDSAGVFKDSTRVDVVPSPPALIQWAFDSTAVGNGGNLSVALSLSRTSTSPLIVKLASTDSFIAKPTVKTVTIPANVSGTSVTVSGLSAGRVSLVAQDSSGFGYLSDTMVVTVVSTIEFREIGQFSRQQYFYVNRNETHRAQVFLSDPAPAGGLGVTFVYKTGGGVVTPSPAIIPAGQLAADVVIQGLTAGRDSVVPTSGGFVGRFSYVDVAAESLRIQLDYPYNGVLGVGQRYQPYVYYTYAMDHPLTISLALSPAIGTVPTSVTVPTGSYYAYFFVGATAPGTATLTASAPGWITDTATLRFGTPRLQAAGTTSIVAGDPSLGYWYGYTLDSLYYGHPVIDTVFITAVSRNPAAVVVDVPTAKVLPGNSSTTASNALRALPTAGGDSAWIVLSATGYQPDSLLVRVTAPTLTLYDNVYPYTGTIGLGTFVQNAGYAQIPYVRPDTFWVVFGHTRRGVLGGPDSVAILPGTTYRYFDVQTDSAGVDTLSIVRATGYIVTGSPKVYRTVPLRARPYSYPSTLYTISPPGRVNAIVTDSVYNYSRPLLAPLTVSLTSLNPAAFALDSPTVTIPAGAYFSNYDTVRVVGVDTIGSYFVASAAGMTPDSSILVRVYPTPLNIGFGYPYLVSRGLKLQNNYVSITGGNAPATIPVALSHTNPSIDSLSRDTVLILAGQNFSQYFEILGLDSTGTDTIVATATGYVTDRAVIQTQASRLDVSDPGANRLTTDPPFRLRTYTETRIGYGMKPFAPVTYTIASSNPNVIRIDSAGPGGAVNGTRDTATAVVDTATGYSDVWISFVGSGTARLYVSTPGFDSDSTAPTTVTGPSLNLAYPTLTVGTGQLFTSQYVYVSNPVTAPLVVRLVRSDSGLPPASQAFTMSRDVAGVPVAIDSVVINTGQTSSAFFDVGGNAIGSANIVALAPGYSQDISTVSVGQPQLSVTPTVALYVGERPRNVTVFTYDQSGSSRIVATPTIVADSSSDSTVAKADSASRTIPRRSSSTTFAIRPLAKGGVNVVFSSAGYRPDTLVVSVDTAKLALTNPPNGLGPGQVAASTMYVDIPYTTDSALVVTLASTNSGVLTVPASVTISAGGSFAYFDVTGVATGTASIIATAPHSLPDTQAVVIGTPQLVVSLTAATNAGQRYTFSVISRDSLNATRTVAAPLAVTLVSSNPGHTVFDSTTTTLAAGQSSVSMGVVFDTAGSYTVTASATGYTSGNAVTTTTGAQVLIQDFLFNPGMATIRAGQRVTWRNAGAVSHTSTEDALPTPLWNSGTIVPNATYQRLFSTVGTFTYHCTIHPGMTGTVQVNP